MRQINIRILQKDPRMNFFFIIFSHLVLLSCSSGNQDDIERAIAVNTQLINQHPDYAYAYYYRGNAYEKKREFQKAVTDYEIAIRLKPNFAQALTGLGYVYNIRGEINRAMLEYEKSIAADPLFPLAYRLRADVLNDRGEYHRAIADYDKSIKLEVARFFENPYSRKLFQRSRHFDEIIDYFSQIIKGESSDAEAYLWRGAAYYFKGKQDKALKDYNLAIELDPALAEAYVGRGLVHRTQKGYTKSVDDFGEAIRLKPDIPVVYYYRGDVYSYYLRDYKSAITDFTNMLKLTPNDVRGYDARGLALVLNGESGKAIADFKRILELSDDPAICTQAKQQIKEINQN